jgi:hypothetical protein
MANQKDLATPVAPALTQEDNTLPATYELEQGLTFSSKSEQQQFASSSDSAKGKKKRQRS